jgi:hypothetical protein
VSKSLNTFHPRLRFAKEPRERPSLEKIKQPIASVEEKERDRKHDPRVLVDDVDVFDLGHRRLQHQRPLADGVQHFGPVHRVACNKIVINSRGGCPRGRTFRPPEPQPRRSPVVVGVSGSPRDPEARRELGRVQVAHVGLGVVPVPDGRYGAHAHVLELDDVLVGEARLGGLAWKKRACHPSKSRLQQAWLHVLIDQDLAYLLVSCRPRLSPFCSSSWPAPPSRCS